MSRARNDRSVATVLPASGGRLPLGAVLPDVGEHLLLGVGQRQAVVELVEQARSSRASSRTKSFIWSSASAGRLDDQVDAVAEHVEVEVGHQGRHLDQRVGPEVEPGHLAVDPDESFVHGRHPTSRRLAVLSVTVQMRLSRGLVPRVRAGSGWVWWRAWSSAGSGSSPARSSCPTRPPACAPCAPTTCCPRRSCRRSATCCPCSRSWSGVCLVLGLLTRAAAVLSALLFVAFIVGIASAWARGLQIECGCFGGGGTSAERRRRLPVGDRPRRRPAGCSRCGWSGGRARRSRVDNLLFRRTEKGSRMSKKSAERSRAERAAGRARGAAAAPSAAGSCWSSARSSSRSWLIVGDRLRCQQPPRHHRRDAGRRPRPA